MQRHDRCYTVQEREHRHSRHNCRSTGAECELICLSCDGNRFGRWIAVLTRTSDFYGQQKLPLQVSVRCISPGTNAWTDTDHTCYTLTTAGSEGFLTLLPIYLDHIFQPLMTDSQFLTEVHRVNGKGENGGVVYCEMQDKESDMNTMVNWELMKRLYCGCGYAVETGGRLLNLYTSTTNEKV